MRTRSLTLLAASIALALSCGDDNGTGSGNVTFPTIPPSTLSAYCIRGQAIPPETVSGGISTGDCHTAITNDGYFEGFRVRVGSSGAVTFTVTSNFDSWLELIRIDNLNDVAGSAVLLDDDDDSGVGFDALLTFTLQPNTEYVIFVSGYDDSETGTYSLAITR